MALRGRIVQDSRRHAAVVLVRPLTWRLLLKPFKQFVASVAVGDFAKLLSSVNARVVGQMQIHQRRLQGAVAEEFLDPAQRCFGFEQVRRHRVAQRVRRNGLANGARFSGSFDAVLDAAGANRSCRTRGGLAISSVCRKDQLGVAMLFPVVAENLERALG